MLCVERRELSLSFSTKSITIRWGVQNICPSWHNIHWTKMFKISHCTMRLIANWIEYHRMWFIKKFLWLSGMFLCNSVKVKKHLVHDCSFFNYPTLYQIFILDPSMIFFPVMLFIIVSNASFYSLDSIDSGIDIDSSHIVPGIYIIFLYPNVIEKS